MAPPGGGLPDKWYRDRATLEAEYGEHGTFEKLQSAHGVAISTLRWWWRKHDLPKLSGGSRPAIVANSETGDEWLLDAIKKLGDEATVEQLADQADEPPKRVRAAAERLVEAGYRITLGEVEDKVVLERVPRPSMREHKVLFAGETYRFGIASDAHLNSKHCRLDELHIAYDRFKAEGIETVYNPGDIVAGRGIFRGQDHEIINHTFETQKQYAIDNYPKRPGILTKIISGNHDAEGDFGRAGADACHGVANEREDIEWCGMYAADFVLPNGAVMTMRHPMGGSSYAKSYKPQKFAESFEGGTKPNVVLFGHWHNMLYTIERNIHMLNCGTFEGYGGTLGLRVPLGAPAVGFFIVELTVGADASVVRFRPEWFSFFGGRKVRAA